MRTHRRPFVVSSMYILAAVFCMVVFEGVVQAAATESNRAVTLRTAPVYPEMAKRMHVSGVVTIRVFVLPNGTVSQTHVEGGHPLLRNAAEDAVHQWKFAPAAESSECLVQVSFEFSEK